MGVDDCLCDWERGQSCYGNHRRSGHHGVEDERQAVGHVTVWSAGKSWSVTYGEERSGKLKQQRSDLTVWIWKGVLQQRNDSRPFSSTANTLAPFTRSSWTTTVSPFLAATCRGLQESYTKSRLHWGAPTHMQNTHVPARLSVSDHYKLISQHAIHVHATWSMYDDRMVTLQLTLIHFCFL